jgi:hypothetical protein
METLKELCIDALILLAGLLIMSASNIVSGAKGLTCGRVETSAQARP